MVPSSLRRIPRPNEWEKHILSFLLLAGNNNDTRFIGKHMVVFSTHPANLSYFTIPDFPEIRGSSLTFHLLFTTIWGISGPLWGRYNLTLDTSEIVKNDGFWKNVPPAWNMASFGVSMLNFNGGTPLKTKHDNVKTTIFEDVFPIAKKTVIFPWRCYFTWVVSGLGWYLGNIAENK